MRERRGGRTTNYGLGGCKRGATGPKELGYLSGVYHVASLLRATTEWSHSVVTAITLRHRLMYGRAQHLKATRKTPYPTFFIVVVVGAPVTGAVVVVVGRVVVGAPVTGAVVVVVGRVVVVIGATWLFTVSTTGLIGC